MKRRLSFRWTLAIVVVAIMATAIGFAVATSGAARTNKLTTVTTTVAASSYPTRNLPPSRDNDAGRARSLDSTPDNDTDAWQRG